MDASGGSSRVMLAAASPSERHNPSAISALGQFVFVKLSQGAFQRPSPSRPVISDAVGERPAPHCEINARSVDSDDGWLVDKQDSLDWHTRSLKPTGARCVAKSRRVKYLTANGRANPAVSA